MARTPEEIAADLLVEVEAEMHAPEVLADPPEGTPSIVTLPVFIEVTNWVGVIADSATEGGVTVNIEATPTLLFYSGVPGETPVVCNPPGTRFDPAGPDPVEQASAPGACAYVYDERSGVDGRPEAWPAEVVVNWEVRWWATPGGEGDTFPPMSLSTGIPRQVNEVQTLVVDGASD